MKKRETMKKSTEVVPRICTHRYATRYSRTAFNLSPTSQTSQAHPVAHSHRVVACNKSRKRAFIHSLSRFPKELISNILLHLPAKVLYEEMRYVCRDWYDIINDPTFIRAHSQLSSIGILIHDWTKQDMALYLQANGAEVKLTELRMPFRANIVANCNGLVLLHDSTNHELFHVVNLITKVKVSLPPIVGLRRCSVMSTALSYASSGHYKVVHVSDDVDDGDNEKQLMICTVSVDKEWRKLDIQGISMTTRVRNKLLAAAPYSIAGLIYWFYCFSSFVLALDVDAETFSQIPTPVDSSTIRPYKCAPYRTNLDTGLGLLYNLYGPGLPVVWELTDVSTAKWTKVFEMDRAVFDDRLGRMFYPSTCFLQRPHLLMKNGDFWFGVDVDNKCFLVCYNLKKETIVLCPTDRVNVRLRPFPHVNTLLPLKNI